MRVQCRKARCPLFGKARSWSMPGYLKTLAPASSHSVSNMKQPSLSWTQRGLAHFWVPMLMNTGPLHHLPRWLRIPGDLCRRARHPQPGHLPRIHVPLALHGVNPRTQSHRLKQSCFFQLTSVNELTGRCTQPSPGKFQPPAPASGLHETVNVA